MSDVPRPPDSLEQRLGLVARGVQRMADSFGSLEERLQALTDRMDEYRVRSRSETAQVAERVERLEAESSRALELLRSIEAGMLERRGEETVARPGLDSGSAERLIEVIRGLRDDVAVAIGEVRVDTTASIERIITDQGARLARLHDAIGLARESVTPSSNRLDELQRAVDEVRDELRSVHGEIVTGSGQIRTDLAADAAALRARLLEEVAAAPAPGDERLVAIEEALTSLRDELAIERLESSLRHMGGELERVVEDTSGLRNDVRRSFERVLLSIDNAEQSVVGEVRAIDSRLGGMADDLRLVRSLRDGLEALASGVDAVRQLASRSATTTQMTELTRDLSAVLAEIEAARAQVLAVDQRVGLVQASAIDISAPDDDIHRSVEHLERTVTDEISELGRRIEELASQATPAPVQGAAGAPAEDPLVRRLRSLATSARQLGRGVAEDLKSRRGTPRS